MSADQSTEPPSKKDSTWDFLVGEVRSALFQNALPLAIAVVLAVITGFWTLLQGWYGPLVFIAMLAVLMIVLVSLSHMRRLEPAHVVPVRPTLAWVVRIVLAVLVLALVPSVFGRFQDSPKNDNPYSQPPGKDVPLPGPDRPPAPTPPNPQPQPQPTDPTTPPPKDEPKRPPKREPPPVPPAPKDDPPPSTQPIAGVIGTILVETRLTCALKAGAPLPPTSISVVQLFGPEAYFEGPGGKFVLSIVSPVRVRRQQDDTVVIITRFSSTEASDLVGKPVEFLSALRVVVVPVQMYDFQKSLASMSLFETLISVNGGDPWYNNYALGAVDLTDKKQGPEFSIALNGLLEFVKR